MGPAFFLWLVLGVARFLCALGLLVLVVCTDCSRFILTGLMYWNQKRYMLPVVVTFMTMAIAGLVIHEGIQPLVEQRSSVAYAPVVAQYDGDIYYYGDYSASLVYYTDKEVTKIEDDALPNKNKERSNAWEGKNKMPAQTVEEVTERFQAALNNEARVLQSVTNDKGQATRLPMGKNPTEPMPIDNPVALHALILVPEKYRGHFEKSSLAPMVKLLRVENKIFIYETR